MRRTSQFRKKRSSLDSCKAPALRNLADTTLIQVVVSGYAVLKITPLEASFDD